MIPATRVIVPFGFFLSSLPHLSLSGLSFFDLLHQLPRGRASRWPSAVCNTISTIRFERCPNSLLIAWAHPPPPSATMAIFSRQSKGHTSNYSDPMHPDYRKSTPWALRLFVAVCYLLSTVFLILVEIGNVNGKSVIRDTFFININLANIIPVTVPNAQLINSVARSIGLHDFYQVGLWNFCEGYNDQGITHCSKPQTLYWFNPVEILPQ